MNCGHRASRLKKVVINIILPLPQPPLKFAERSKAVFSLSHLISQNPTSGGAVLCSKLIDRRRQVQSPVTRVDLAVVFFKTRVNMGQDPSEKSQQRALPCRPRSQKRTVGLKTYNPTYFTKNVQSVSPNTSHKPIGQ